MDPNATLAELRRLYTASQEDGALERDELDRVLELFDALDTWLLKGGFLPTDWAKDRNTLEATKRKGKHNEKTAPTWDI